MKKKNQNQKNPPVSINSDQTCFGVYSAKSFSNLALENLKVEVLLNINIAKVTYIQDYSNFDEECFAIHIFTIWEGLYLDEIIMECDGARKKAIIENVDRTFSSADKSKKKLSAKANKTQFTLPLFSGNTRYVPLCWLASNKRIRVCTTFLQEVNQIEKYTFLFKLEKKYFPLQKQVRNEQAEKDKLDGPLQYTCNYDLTIQLGERTKLVSLNSATHELITVEEKSHCKVKLKNGDKPDSDLSLSYKLINFSGLFHNLSCQKKTNDLMGILSYFIDERHFNKNESKRKRRELVFILDCSGSMAGPYFEASREAIICAVKSLPSFYYFNLITLTDEALLFYAKGVQANDANIKTFIDSLKKMKISYFESQNLVDPCKILNMLIENEAAFTIDTFILSDWRFVGWGDTLAALAKQDKEKNRISVFAVEKELGFEALNQISNADKLWTAIVKNERELIYSFISRVKDTIRDFVYDIDLFSSNDQVKFDIIHKNFSLNRVPVPSEIRLYVAFEKIAFLNESFPLTLSFATEFEEKLELTIMVTLDCFEDNVDAHKIVFQKITNDIVEQQEKFKGTEKLDETLRRMSEKYAILTKRAKIRMEEVEGEDQKKKPDPQIIEPSKDPFTVLIQTLSGVTSEVSVSPFCSLFQLKSLISKIKGIEPSQQRLVFRGTPLNNDGDLIKDLNIDHLSIIHFIPKLRPMGDYIFSFRGELRNFLIKPDFRISELKTFLIENNIELERSNMGLVLGDLLLTEDHKFIEAYRSKERLIKIIALNQQSMFLELPLVKLIEKQNCSGFWDLDLEILQIISFEDKDFQAVQEKLENRIRFNYRERAAITVTVLCYLEKKWTQEKQVWQLVFEKGVLWLLEEEGVEYINLKSVMEDVF